MKYSIEDMKKRIEQLRQERSLYAEVLNLYEKIREEQALASPSISVNHLTVGEKLRTLEAKEGFPLIGKEDFVLDIPSSVALFESICHIAKNANEKMHTNILALEDAFSINALNLKELLKRHFDQSYIEKTAEEFDIDKTILKFLIHSGIQPSLEANVGRLKDQVDHKNWLKGYCPICGSLPQISELNGEGNRYLLCSFCGLRWPVERLKCPFCENSEHDKLHYLYAEGQESCRIDLCDNCNHYIKTVDSRKLGCEPDLELEDITSLHLDILATDKGYKRISHSLWVV
jgi:FdhE protein